VEGVGPLSAIPFHRNAARMTHRKPPREPISKRTWRGWPLDALFINLGGLLLLLLVAVAFMRAMHVFR
jgi:hypothetical protein